MPAAAWGPRLTRAAAGASAEEVERAFVLVNKLRRKWHSFARLDAPPSPPAGDDAAGALVAAEAAAEAVLEEEAEWEASEEEEEKEDKLSDEAGLVGGLRRALLQARHSQSCRVSAHAQTPPVPPAGAHAVSLPQARRPQAVVRRRATPPPPAADGTVAAAVSTAPVSGTAEGLFRVMHTHQRCAAPVADSAIGVFLFEAGCAASGLAAGALIVVRKRRTAVALAVRAGLPRPPGMSCL